MTKERKDIIPKEFVPSDDDGKFTFRQFYMNYARFHSEKHNILIHLIFVPLIGLSQMGMFDYYNLSMLIDPAKLNQSEFPISVGNHEGYKSDGDYY